MSICNPDIFFSNINKGEKLLGIDYGDKIFGLAISDENLKISNPLGTIKRNNIGGIVIGWPLNMDGSQGFRCDATRDFCYALLKIHDIPICLHDERLSSLEAEEVLKEGNVSKKKLKFLINSVAASLILQDFLNFNKHLVN